MKRLSTECTGPKNSSRFSTTRLCMEMLLLNFWPHHLLHCMANTELG